MREVIRAIETYEAHVEARVWREAADYIDQFGGTQSKHEIAEYMRTIAIFAEDNSNEFGTIQSKD